MRDIKKDVIYGKKHENKIKPTIDKIFGELTLSEDQFANFDFYNNDYYVEHKKRSIVSDKYESLYFDKVKYDKYLELKEENPKLRFFIIWTCFDGSHIWEFQPQVKPCGECCYYETTQRNQDRGKGYLQNTRMINVWNCEIQKLKDFKL